MSAKQSFSQLLTAVAQGDFDQRCTEEMNKVVAAVEAGNGDGEVTIKIKFKKDKRMMQVESKVTAKIPTMGVDKSLFFVDAQNRLTEDDPKQTTISFPRPARKLVNLEGGASKTPAESDDTTKKEN
jgi:hypothetical protein